MERHTFDLSLDMVIKEHRDLCHRHHAPKCVACAIKAAADARECIVNLSAQFGPDAKLHWFKAQAALWQLVADGVLK